MRMGSCAWQGKPVAFGAKTRTVWRVCLKRPEPLQRLLVLCTHAELLVLDEDLGTQGGRGRELIGVVVRQEGRQQL